MPGAKRTTTAAIRGGPRRPGRAAPAQSPSAPQQSPPVFDVDAALRVIDAANPPPLEESRRRLFAKALVLLVEETLSGILAAAEDRRTAAIEAEGRSRTMALDAWVSDARRRGEIGVVQAWSLQEQLWELRTWAEPGRPHPASRPGRKPKGDVRVYGALLCLYETMTGRRAEGDKDTIAFVRSFMDEAGKTFAAAEHGSVHPPRGKTADARWRPLTPDAFRKRFQQFEAAKDPARARQLVERAGEEKKE